MSQIKFIINPSGHKDNFLASKANKKFISQLEIALGVRMIRKHAKYYSELIKSNNNKKAVVTIDFV